MYIPQAIDHRWRMQNLSNTQSSPELSATATLESQPTADSRSLVHGPCPVESSIEGTLKPIKGFAMIGLTRNRLICQLAYFTINISIKPGSLSFNQKYNIVNLVCKKTNYRIKATFSTSSEAESFLNCLQQQISDHTDSQENFETNGEGVALIGPSFESVPSTEKSMISHTDISIQTATLGLQLIAATQGADAIKNLVISQTQSPDSIRYTAYGHPVIAKDNEERASQRIESYNYRTQLIAKTVLIASFAQFVMWILNQHLFGEPSNSSIWASNGDGNSVFYDVFVASLIIWPTVLAFFLWMFNSPRLLVPTALAALIIPGSTVLFAYATQVIAIWVYELPYSKTPWYRVVSFLHVVYIFFSVSIFLELWKHRRLVKQLLPIGEVRHSSSVKNFVVGLVGITAIWLPVTLGLNFNENRELLTYVIQPGVDIRRSDLAYSLLKRGVDYLSEEQPNLKLAEAELQRGLVQWESLGGSTDSPTEYRVNLICCLCNLGLIREYQKRNAEAIDFFKRCDALGREVLSRKDLTPDLLEIIKDSQERYAFYQQQSLDESLNAKVEEAEKLREQAVVSLNRGDLVSALDLFLKVVALLGEVLPESSSEYRANMIKRLAGLYLQITELQVELDKFDDAKASLNKAIDFTSQASSDGKPTTMISFYIDQCRVRKAQLDDVGVYQEIQKLFESDRMKEAIGRWTSYVDNQDQDYRSSDREPSEELVALHTDRLTRLALFLASCEPSMRNTEKSVELAQKASDISQGSFESLYNLAMLTYRGAQYDRCEETIKQIGSKFEESSTRCLFLSAMNNHKRNQTRQAELDLQGALQWMQAMEQKAMQDSNSRILWELQRSQYESLKEEAIALIRRKPDA